LARKDFLNRPSVPILIGTEFVMMDCPLGKDMHFSHEGTKRIYRHKLFKQFNLCHIKEL